VKPTKEAEKIEKRAKDAKRRILSKRGYSGM
jgi:hypothetical protein